MLCCVVLCCVVLFCVSCAVTVRYSKDTGFLTVTSVTISMKNYNKRMAAPNEAKGYDSAEVRRTAGGNCTQQCCVMLCCVELCCVVLCFVVLRCFVLCCVVLWCVVL